LAGLLRSHTDINALRHIRKWRIKMKYHVITWAAISWIVVCIAPYFYALNDLITWR
jgi:hypothetical protein